MNAGTTKIGGALLAVVAVLALSPMAARADEFHGLVLEVKVDKCGMKPGACKGSVVIGYCEAGVIRVAVEPGATTITRGGHEVELKELKYGDKVNAELMSPLPPEETPGYERPAGIAKAIEIR